MMKAALTGLVVWTAAAIVPLGVVLAPVVASAQAADATATLSNAIKASVAQAEAAARAQGLPGTVTCAVGDANGSACPFQTLIETAIQDAIAASGATPETAAAAVAQARSELAAGMAPATAAAFAKISAQIAAGQTPTNAPAASGGQAGASPIAPPPAAGGGGGGSDYRPNT